MRGSVFVDLHGNRKVLKKPTEGVNLPADADVEVVPKEPNASTLIPVSMLERSSMWTVRPRQQHIHWFPCIDSTQIKHRQWKRTVESSILAGIVLCKAETTTNIEAEHILKGFFIILCFLRNLTH
ncbi:hypothetical protein RB195_010293 [Necator americanus]|uniref:Uncharacterized protein n=1 Tax=Necator americanus TaxID=51031 RepID=A0ABR1CXA3_NECAM